MTLSDAERQRRHRAHKAGNHEHCADESVCLGLGERGQRLYRELKPREWDPAYRVMIEELCRLADRAERLDSFLRGETDVWLHVLRDVDDHDGSTIVVKIDGVMDSARANTMAYKQILTELRQGLRFRKREEAAGSKAGVTGEGVAGDNITSLASYIERARKEAGD